ncbi:hypothetical protein HU200_053328 [Digitaria exilis]|uniref:Replication protein A subunit n=1 Tax=Digitaria exilis TaxID=1010633 RepID=A0A835E8R9_9POAL|nr:hypothetical protein HU200_053328 [Digitaria exilis]
MGLPQKAHGRGHSRLSPQNFSLSPSTCSVSHSAEPPPRPSNPVNPPPVAHPNLSPRSSPFLPPRKSLFPSATMAAPAQLTTGGVAAVSEHVDGDATLQPVLQVADVRKVPNPQKNPAAAERFRMALSDGVHTMQSMLATAINPLVLNGVIQRGSVIHLQEFTCSTIQNRRIIIVIRLDVLQSECDIIGNPRPYVSPNLPTEQSPNIPANAAQVNSGAYPNGPGTLRAAEVANNVSHGGHPNILANAAQVNSGTYPSGPGTLGSSVAPRVAEVANNVSHGGTYGGHQGTVDPPVGRSVDVSHVGSYGGYPGTVGPPTGRAVEPVTNVSSGGSYGTTSAHNTVNADMMRPNLQQPLLNSRSVEPVPNVSSGGSYGIASTHNTMNADMVQRNLQQPSLSSHQNHRLAVPSMSGGIGTPGNTYGRPAQSANQQPHPGHMNRGPVAKDEATRFVPVTQMNPYQTGWTIKARVTAKSDVRHYKNDRGSGKVFSFDLLDAQGGEIRMTCFNAHVDQFFDLIEVDKVYKISRGTLKPAQKKFNPLNNEYEITADFKTSIEVFSSDDSSIPRQQYDFRQISEIESIEVGAIVDLVGIVTSVCPSVSITRKDGSEAQKRTLQLKDMSGRSVEITFWGKFCDAEGQQLQSLCDSGLNPVLALKSVRVTEFNGRSVNSIGSTQLKINPDLTEAEKLQHWYATEGKNAVCVSLSTASMGKTDIRKTVVQVKDENLGRSEKPDWITVKGSISHVNTDNFCYPACTIEMNGRQCNKKVINNGDGTWHCEKCGQNLPNCEYRYLLLCQIQDHTGLTYATAFQEAGVEIIGCSAEELYNIKEEDAERFTEIIQGVRWQLFLFKLKVFEEIFNDEQRVKCSITKAEKLDVSRECSYLLKSIGATLQDETGSPSKVQGAMSYNAGINDPGAGQSVPASNSANAMGMGTRRYGESGNLVGRQANTYGGASTPLSATRNVLTCMGCGLSGHNAENCHAGMYRQQQPAASTASSYGSSPGNAGSGVCYRCNQPGHYASSCPAVDAAAGPDSGRCYRCNQPGHYANACPGAGAAPQQQPYGSGVASGGYGRQSYVRATNY